MQAERLKMHSAMPGLLNVIGGKFPEIDLEEVSKAAARRYDKAISSIKVLNLVRDLSSLAAHQFSNSSQMAVT